MPDPLPTSPRSSSVGAESKYLYLGRAAQALASSAPRHPVGPGATTGLRGERKFPKAKASGMHRKIISSHGALTK